MEKFLVHFQTIDQFEIPTSGQSSGDDIDAVLERIDDGKFLFVSNERFLGVVKEKGSFYIYNCHPTNLDPMKRPLSESDAATIVEAKTGKEAADLIKSFCYITTNSTHIFVLPVADDQNFKVNKLKLTNKPLILDFKFEDELENC